MTDVPPSRNTPSRSPALYRRALLIVARIVLLGGLIYPLVLALGALESRRAEDGEQVTGRALRAVQGPAAAVS